MSRNELSQATHDLKSDGVLIPSEGEGERGHGPGSHLWSSAASGTHEMEF